MGSSIFTMVNAKSILYTKSILYMAVIFIIFSLTTILLIGSNVNNTDKYRLVTVKKGDNLWNIAKKHVDDGSDIRRFVWQIKRENKLSSSLIYPGQELKIPLSDQVKNCFAKK